MLDILYTIIVYPIELFIEFVFVFSIKVFKNTGLSVVSVSIAVSLLCLPLYIVAEKWQQLERDIQKRLKPKIEKIKNVFKGDEQYMILSTYYRQNHYHPVYAMRSTFGLLIQIPFFIAAYSFLSHLEVLEEVPFLFVHDLSIPDGLFPVASLSVNILPIAMTVINLIAGSVYLRGFLLKDKVQLYGMAMVFLVLLYNSPSALVLYWTMNNIFSLIKNCYFKITYKHKFKIILILFSVACILLSFYLIVIHHGNINLRILLAVLFLSAGGFPWISLLTKYFLGRFPVVGKFPLKIPFITIPQPRTNSEKSLGIFFISFSAVWVLTGFFLPSQLIVSSPLEFSYIDDHANPIFFIANAAMQSFGFFVFWAPCLFFLFPQKIKNIFIVAAPIFLMLALCNAFLFAGNYGIISVNLVYDTQVSHGQNDIIRNLIILLIIAAIVFFLFFVNKQKIIIIVTLSCLFSITGLSLFNIVLIQKEYAASQEYHAGSISKLTRVEPVFNLSNTGKNTIIIMLDRAISVFFPYILDESPELYALYKGFTYYPNTVSFNGHTGIGAPPVFGGYEYTPEEVNKRDQVSVRTKHNESLLMLPRIFSELGYLVTVTDPPYPDYSTKDDLRIYDEYPRINALITDSVYTKLWINEHNIYIPSTSEILERNLFMYSIFKIVPLAFRRGIYLDGDWCALVSSQKMSLFLNGYSVLDYLPELTGMTNDKKNTALIMVNNTTHETLFLQAPDYRPKPNITDYGKSKFKREMAYHINAAAIKRIADWFEYLKNHNMYDNSRIILVSDHGPEPNFVVKAGLPFNVEQFNPLLLVKDFNANGDLQTDMTFMSNADVSYLALKDQIEKPVNPFTGKEINTKAKYSRLYIAISGGIHLEDPMSTVFTLDPKKDYYVHDNIFNPANWERAEK
jgi:YidC/Oxa1 family membrane protein insertase